MRFRATSFFFTSFFLGIFFHWWHFDAEYLHVRILHIRRSLSMESPYVLRRNDLRRAKEWTIRYVILYL